MTKRTLLTALLSTILVLGLVTSGSAAVWTATTGVGTEYTKTAGTWNSGAVSVSDTNTLFSFDFNVVGSWDGKSDPRTRLTDVAGEGKATWDWLTINVYKDGALYSTYTYDDIDNNGNSFDPRLAGANIHYESLLALSGTYVFEAIGHMTMDNGLEAETWVLNGANVTVTPIPAAVWLLGSGLLGITGFRRIRNRG